MRPAYVAPRSPKTAQLGVAEETLATLDGLVRAGKVRALGCSLVERSIELELLPFCRAAGLGGEQAGIGDPAELRRRRSSPIR